MEMMEEILSKLCQATEAGQSPDLDHLDAAVLLAELDRLHAEQRALCRELLTPQVFNRLLAWLRSPNPAPAATAFTAGIERQLAYALEMDVLPEIKRLHHALALANEWRTALESHVIVCEGGASWHSNDPYTTLMGVIAWHVAVALDPQVSWEAAQIRQKALEEVLAEWEKPWTLAQSPFVERLRRMVAVGRNV